MSTKNKQKVKTPTLSKGPGKRVTLPGMGVNVTDALRQFRAGTFEEKINTYYDSEIADKEAYKDFPQDISKLSKIEQMELLHEVRKVNEEQLEKLYKMNVDNDKAKKHNAAIDAKRSAAKNNGGATEGVDG